MTLPRPSLTSLAALAVFACAEAPPPSVTHTRGAALPGFAGKADQPVVPFGGPDTRRWRAEAIVANAAAEHLAGAPAGAVVSVPLALVDSGERPFGDGQSNARAELRGWSVARPPVVAVLRPGAPATVDLHLDRALPAVGDALVVEWWTGAADTPAGSATLSLTVDAEGHRRARWSVPSVLDFGAAASAHVALVRPLGWADGFPLRFRMPVHAVDALLDTAPARTLADGRALPDPAGLAQGGQPHGWAGPFRATDLHGHSHGEPTAVGGGDAWVMEAPDAPFKHVYLCMDPRDAAVEARHGTPSGTGWHAIGDAAETLANTVAGGPLLVGYAEAEPLPPARYDAVGAGAAYGLDAVASFRRLLPGEALVTGRRPGGAAVFHWFAALPERACAEIYVHDCAPGVEATFACADATTTVQVSVRAETAWGETIRVVGDHPALGSWDPASGLALSADPDYPVWRGALPLAPGTPLELKLVRVAADGAVTWASGPNQRYTVPQAGDASLDLAW